MSLTAKHCTPCQGGTPPMGREDAEQHRQQVPEWRIAEEPMRLERSFKFKNFRKALDFVNRVGELAEEEGHHPEIHFGWGHVEVEVWTHKISGLHENDFILAAKIDQLV